MAIHLTAAMRVIAIGMTSVIAHITADELRRTLTEVEAANGFGNRFLWLCVQRSQLLPEGGNYPDRALEPLRQRLEKAILAARQVARMERSAAARLLWRDIYTALAEGAPGLVGALTARAEAQVLRLSMLYALSNLSHTADGDDYSTRIVGQRGPLRIQEHQRLFWLYSREEGVQHQLLIVAVLYPGVRAGAGDARLDIRFEIQ